MYENNIDNHIQSLLRFLIEFPLPTSYRMILREQIMSSVLHIEQYTDCFKILFENKRDTNMFPLDLPTLLQGGQILKESGPISFQLFVENGYVVQFEVVDMGLNEIDWEYFWTHSPVYDIEYQEF